MNLISLELGVLLMAKTWKRLLLLSSIQEKGKGPQDFANLISFIYFGGVRMNEIKKWEYVTSFYRLATIYIIQAKCEVKMFKFL